MSLPGGGTGERAKLTEPGIVWSSPQDDDDDDGDGDDDAEARVLLMIMVDLKDAG